MKVLKFKVLLFVTVLLFSLGVQGQINENVGVIKSIYNALQNSNTTSKEIKALTSTLNWEEIKSTKDVNERYTITLSAIVKNEWRGVSFKNLEYRKIEENKVLVTGTVSGRQPTECEGVTTTFQHLWTFKDGQIIQLTE